eukprot:TRINITY_DN9127_c0_g1_i2.p1 TRINITY_DN9127_c0_g1~~TRINITY_DN9127_c0_g1_i2.p1  ORF type:complete len:741 (-),score=160.82 TRINITY_DN9127_c0_g1_i2:136-2067(-)
MTDERATTQSNENGECRLVGVTLKHDHVTRVKESNIPEGVKYDNHIKKPNGDVEFRDPMCFAVGAKQSRDTTVTSIPSWESSSTEHATRLWKQFSDHGELNPGGFLPSSSSSSSSHPPSGGAAVHGEAVSRPGTKIAAAVANKVRVPAGEKRTLVFVLSWDVPVARFALGTAYYRRYTRFYGRTGTCAGALARDAMVHYRDWDRMIQDWQHPIASSPDLPDWYKMALLNEVYYVADGGSMWTDGRADGHPEGDSPATIEREGYMGQFAYLEGQEYLMYNTYDVHFYASFALIQLWPHLELGLQRDIAAATMMDHVEEWDLISTGKMAPRKVKGAVPHDMGNPGEHPWTMVNSYNIQDISRWKDLPSKFVLQVYRDYVITGDDTFLRDMWPVVVEALEKLSTFDTDGDGIVDNEGFPDQTYDTWSATGCSSYCGGLYVASLQAACAIAEHLGQPEEANKYRLAYQKGQETLDAKLWTGKYYRYDCSASSHRESIMADQLAGHWYSHACGLGGIVPKDKAISALKTVYEYNVLKFGDGGMGAVNGMRPNGKVDTTCLQSSEVWTGTSYAVAAAMLQDGLMEEGFSTARGIVDGTYSKFGYMFQTPEAWDVRGNYRAYAYMRPLAIWAMHWAMNKDKTSKREGCCY